MAETTSGRITLALVDSPRCYQGNLRAPPRPEIAEGGDGSRTCRRVERKPYLTGLVYGADGGDRPTDGSRILLRRGRPGQTAQDFSLCLRSFLPLSSRTSRRPPFPGERAQLLSVNLVFAQLDANCLAIGLDKTAHKLYRACKGVRMKLMKAEVTMVAYVVVQEGEDAERAGLDALQEEVQDNGIDEMPIMTMTLVTSSASVPRDWLNAIPWGEGGDRTVLEWIGEARAAEETE